MSIGQELYLRSVNHTVDAFNGILPKLLQDGSARITLANLDLDIGAPVKLGDYPLADKAHAELLKRITSTPRRSISKGLKEHILAIIRRHFRRRLRLYVRDTTATQALIYASPQNAKRPDKRAASCFQIDCSCGNGSPPIRHRIRHFTAACS